MRPILDLYIFSYMRTCAMYDSTVKAMGFDEIRVRYRHQRRDLIRNIILKKLVGETMKTYIDMEISNFLPQQDQQAFYEDVLEDLKEIDQSRVASLRITLEELNAWRLQAKLK